MPRRSSSSLSSCGSNGAEVFLSGMLSSYHCSLLCIFVLISLCREGAMRIKNISLIWFSWTWGKFLYPFITLPEHLHSHLLLRRSDFPHGSAISLRALVDGARHYGLPRRSSRVVPGEPVYHFKGKKKTTFCIFPTKIIMINYFRFLYYDRQQMKSHYFDKRSIILCWRNHIILHFSLFYLREEDTVLVILSVNMYPIKMEDKTSSVTINGIHRNA